MTKSAPNLLTSYFHTPTDRSGYRPIFHSVLRAGRAAIAPSYHLQSWSHPGHDLILTTAGTGMVRVGTRTFEIDEGQFVWIDHNRNDRNVLWPSRVKPWMFLFVRVDSDQMNMIADALDIAGNPVFVLPKTTPCAAIISNIMTMLRDRPVAMDAALHAAISALVALLFEARQSAELEGRGDSGASPSRDLARLLDAMRSRYQKRWTIEELADLTNLSVPQLFRKFSRATGTTPINWLRRERVNQAKRRLIETRESIGEIAEIVGYSDPLYFSRDFKKLVGLSPRDYRQREQIVQMPTDPSSKT